ncbi:CHASE domain-containing protein [Sideroxyarcus emersonii]|nr:CHASE domain-containing protein [Sideroxyarcus emersonii]
MANNNFRIGVLLKLAPLAVLVVCLLVTVLLWDIMRKSADKELQNEFDVQVRLVQSNIKRRLDNYRDVLRGTAGLFQASESVTRNEFHTYVESMELAQVYPGIQGVGYSLLIPAIEKMRRIEAIRKEGFPQFSIRPEGSRDPYSAIIYLEPFDWRNQRAFGYDMYAEPVRREAMERARDQDTEALSGRVVLVQETGADVQYGFLLYKPIYRNGSPHDSITQRRSSLVGWVYEPFRMNELMNQGVLGRYLETIRDQLDIEIYDGDSVDAQHLMFDSKKNGAGGAVRFVSTSTEPYFARNWTIRINSLPAFEAKLNTLQARMILIGGIFISLLLTLVVWLLATTNTRAIKLAAKMSEQLERTLDQTIGAMATVIEIRDPYTAGHQRRAADLASAIAREMGLGDGQLRALTLAAMTYEIGKIQIPAEILSKPGKLDEVERNLIQVHAQAGFEILREIAFPWPIAKIVQQHHERLDGSGYPQGLRGDDILIEARIIAVADVVEAMLSHRPYRPALGLDAALAEITGQRGVLYDPAVVDACVRLFRELGYRMPD